MRLKLHKILCIPLCLCLLLLCACVPSREYLKKKEQGYYPETEDFPLTKWACRELDLTINMLDNSERTMVGAYTVADTTYRVIARFDCNQMEFDFYSGTEVSDSGYKDKDGNPYATCQQQNAGFLYAEYLYENGTINCSVFNAKVPGGQTIPEKLTFEKVGSIAQIPDKRWHCEEFDMSLISFRDIDGYYQGEIVLDGKTCPIQAYEIGDGNYYALSRENGIIDNLKAGSSSDLIEMIIQQKDDKLFCTVVDSIHINPYNYPDWEDTAATLTFSIEPS